MAFNRNDRVHTVSSSQAPAVFNPEELISLIAVDPAYREMTFIPLYSIAGNGTLPLDQSWHAWRDGRTADAARLLHKVRGSPGSFGLNRFSAIDAIGSWLKAQAQPTPEAEAQACPQQAR